MVSSLPKPAWQGFGVNLTKKYSDFVVAHLRHQIEEEPRRLMEEIDSTRRRLAEYEQELRKYRNKLRGFEEELALVARVMEQPPAAEEIREALSSIEELPYVIGTRLDMQGRLFVQMRVSATVEGKSLDIGDFEVGFALSGRYGGSAYICNYLRIPTRVDPHYDIFSWSLHNYEEGNCASGGVTLENYLFQLGDLVGFVASVHKALATSATHRPDVFSAPEEEPEPVWSGFVSNPLKAYRRSVEMGGDMSLEHIQENLEWKLQGCREEIQYLTPHVRESRTKLRELQAAHAKAAKVAEEAVLEVDTEQLSRDIELIARLPGVMGIKFDEESGVPIIHVRTTHVCDGERYDFGDFEIYLASEGTNDSRRVVKVRATRLSRQGAHLYHHGIGGHREWFCFGGRASELRKMFKGGEFAHFVHFAINSMNAVNEGQDYKRLLDNSYVRIPMDEVWEIKPKRSRLRRRPRNLEEALSED